MKRLALQFVFALLFLGVGWLVGTAGAGAQGERIFRLSIDAPTGETTIKCEDCQFFTWTTDGHASERQPSLSITCTDDHCWKVVGAIAVKPEPKLMAQLDSDLAATQ